MGTRALRAALMAVAVVGMVRPSFAAFELVDQFSVGVTKIHGIATDGKRFYLGHSFTDRFFTFSLDWDILGETTVTAPIGDLRGIAYDDSSGNLFVGDNDNNDVHEVTLGGMPQSSFNVPGSALNAVSYNLVDGTLWTANFDGGLIVQFDTDGNVLSGFADLTKEWTGLAIDPVAETILALETGDTLHEYDYDGNLVADLTIPALGGNGQGIYYDPFTATLYASAHNGTITILHDPARQVIPGPGAVWLLLMSALFGRPGRSRLS